MRLMLIFLVVAFVSGLARFSGGRGIDVHWAVDTVFLASTIGFLITIVVLLGRAAALTTGDERDRERRMDNNSK